MKKSTIITSAKINNQKIKLDFQIESIERDIKRAEQSSRWLENWQSEKLAGLNAELRTKELFCSRNSGPNMRGFPPICFGNRNCIASQRISLAMRNITLLSTKRSWGRPLTRMAAQRTMLPIVEIGSAILSVL